jgi:DNA-binding transcriptional LysR family regulator
MVPFHLALNGGFRRRGREMSHVREAMGGCMGVEEYREFIELARRLNFTEAANELGITQPALSKRIASLEREFGATFFDRSHRTLSLTEAGRVMYGAATEVVEAHDRALRDISRLVRERPIRVDGVLHDEEVTSILSLASILLENDGQPHLLMSPHENRSYTSLLLSGEIDAAIAYFAADKLDRYGIDSMPVTHARFVAVVDADHPLAERNSVSMEELQGETFVQLIDEYCSSGWKCIEDVCRAHGFEPKTRPLLAGPGGLSPLRPAGGEGCVFINQGNLKRNRLMESSNLLRCIPISDEDAYFQLNCVYLRSNKERLAPFLEALAEARDTMQRHEDLRS